MKLKGNLSFLFLVFILMAPIARAQHAVFAGPGVVAPRAPMVNSPVQPFATSPVQPFVTAPVQPFVTSPVQPFVSPPVTPFGVPPAIPGQFAPGFAPVPGGVFSTPPNAGAFVSPVLSVPSQPFPSSANVQARVLVPGGGFIIGPAFGNPMFGLPRR